jgi:hypothetical protein
VKEESGWDLFLCHTGVDKDWTRELGTKIEGETSSGRTLRVFFDEWDIVPATNVVIRLEAGVTSSKCVGVVLSPEMLDAEWPTLEWTMAVYQDPSGRRGKVIPILKRNCDIPPSLRIRNILDFRKPESYEKSYAKLLAVLRNAPLPRGRQSSSQLVPPVGSPEYFAKPLEFAELVNEQLASNLFPLKTFPGTIWKAESKTDSTGQVFSHLRKIISAHALPTFVLRQGNLYCFYDLTAKSCPFRGLITDAATISREETKLWMEDKDKRNWLLQLLNRAVVNKCESLGLFHDRTRTRTFFLPDNGRDRVIEWDTGKRRSKRTVVKRYQRGTTGEYFWSHQSAVIRFTAIDNRLFLRIEPGWTFTSDGVTPLPQNRMSSISSRWMYDEYNPSLFYNLRFWTYVLSEGQRKLVIDSGKSVTEVETTPATIEMNYGIDGDHFSVEKMFEVAEKETPPVDLLIESEEE